MDNDSKRALRAKKAFERSCGFFSESERYSESFYQSMQESVEALFDLHEAKQHEVLGTLLAGYAGDLIGDDRLQEHILFRVPSTVFTTAVRHAKDFTTRVAIATLIPEAERLREMIKDAWERKDVDETAAIYASAYGDGAREDRLAGSRESSLDGYPIELLRALSEYPWPRLPQTDGIRPWLKEELEAREA